MAEIFKKANWIKVERAKAWQAERARKAEQARQRAVRQGWKAQKAEQRGILPAQAKAFNPIRGMAKVA